MKKIIFILLNLLLPLMAAAQNVKDTTPVVPPVSVSTDDELVFAVVEEMPEFPGGDSARIMFVSKNIVYPEALLNVGIEGTVYVKFVVEKDGSLSNIKVMREIGGGSGEEVARVVKLMPNWIPGKQKGKVVRTQFILPVKFSIK